MTAVPEQLLDPPIAAESRLSILHRLADRNLLALVDQAVVSGTSFLTTVLVGRLCGAEELGLYSLGFSIVLLITTVQQALIQTPYTVYYRRTPESERSSYAGSILLHWGMLAILAMAGLLLGSATVAAGFGPPALASILWILVAAIPFLLLRDFARGYAYARLRVHSALLLDVAVSSLQIAGLIALAMTNVLHAASFFAVCGVAGLLGTSLWLWVRRREFRPQWSSARREWGRSWRFGRWVFASGMVSSLNSDAFLVWLLALVLGKASAGIFAACMTIVFFSNPFILGINQILMPRTAHALADGGVSQLRRVVYYTSLLLAAVMGLFGMAVIVWGEDIMRLVYGREFTGHHTTMIAVVGAVLASASGLGPSKGLLALERPNLDLVACTIGFIITAIGATALVTSWGVFGVACGWLAGNVAMTLARFVFFEQQAVALSRRDLQSMPTSPLSLTGAIEL